MSRAHTKKHRIIAVLNYLWRKKLSNTWLCLDAEPHDTNNELITVHVYDIRIFKNRRSIIYEVYNSNAISLGRINERIQQSVDNWMLQQL
jgi:hypothetical protein